MRQSESRLREKSPFHHIPLTKTQEAFFHIEDLSNLIHNDQTGAFPFTSQQGNRCIMVAIHLNANYIFVKPMRSRSNEEMVRAYKKIINRMRLADLQLKKHILDNKASEAFKQCIREQQMQYKLVPPGQSPTQPGRVQDPNVQSARHLDSSRCRQQVPTLPVVPPPQTDQTYFWSNMPINSSTQDISLRTHPQTP